MAKKNKRKSFSAQGAESPAQAATTNPPPPLPPQCTPVTATAPGNVPLLSQSHSKSSTASSRVETVDIVFDESEDMEEEMSEPTPSSKDSIKSDYEILGAGTSCKAGTGGKKKRGSQNSSDSSDEDLSIADRLQLGAKCMPLESPVKKMKVSGKEFHDTRQILGHAELAIPKQSSICYGESTMKYTISTPDGDYCFFGPRREFTIVNLMNSHVYIDMIAIDLSSLPSQYRMLLQHPADSFFLTSFSSNFPNRDESAYRNRQMRSLFYLYEEQRRICDSDSDDLEPLPENIEFGMKGALAAAVDKIRDILIYRTRAEQENVFNQEFYCTHKEDGYKPPFSNTKIYQQKLTSESMMRLAILLLALADAAMDSLRMVAGIGYCYVARRVITEFRLLSLLEQPYKVLDHVIRQKVSAAVYAIELYTKKGSRVVEKPFNDVCESFTEITFTLLTMTTGRMKWEAHKSFKDIYVTDPEFMDFTEEMINPYTHWTIDEHLAWTSDVATAIRTARRMSIIQENIKAGLKLSKLDLANLVKHHLVLGFFEIDADDYENKHLEALVSNFRGLSMAPLLECFKDHEEADEMAIKVTVDLTIAIEAEQKSEKPNPVFFGQMLEDQMYFSLLRLLFHMWEAHKPKDVTRIRLKLLGIRQAATELWSDGPGDDVAYSALVALSSIMYMDYTCGMRSKALEISIAKARMRCHNLAKEHLDSNERSKETCLSFLTVKMEEIQRSISMNKETEESIFESGCWILKIATLAYPILSYFHSIPDIHQDIFLEAENAADESYERKSRQYRYPRNGQKLLYLSVPYNMTRNLMKTQFLKLEEETYEDAAKRKKRRAAAAADHDYAVHSDDDEDDGVEDKAEASFEEQRNSGHFVGDLKPAAQKDNRDSNLNKRPLPNVPTRETLAAALKKFTRPSEAVGVMLEPRRSISPKTDEDSGSRPGSNTPTSDSRNETFEMMKKFKPIDLENFYRDITSGNQNYHLNPFAFGSSTIEELFAKTLIPNADGNAERNFKNSLASVLKTLIICINKLLAKSRKERDDRGKQHWRKWHERIVHFTNELGECRIKSRHGKELLELMHSWSVILGFPTRIFVNPDLS